MASEVTRNLLVAIFGEGYGDGLPDEPEGWEWVGGYVQGLENAQDVKGNWFHLEANYDGMD